MTDPLQCTFDDARRQHLSDGIAMSTADKVAWLEIMVELIVAAGAVDRLVCERRRAINTSQEAP
jgi:hypothetical protein